MHLLPAGHRGRVFHPRNGSQPFLDCTPEDKRPGGAVQEFASLEADDPTETLHSQLRQAGIPAPKAVARLIAFGLAPHHDTRQFEHFLDGVIALFPRFRTTSPRADIAVLVATLAAYEHMRRSEHLDDDVRVFNDVRLRLFEHLATEVRDLTAAFAVVGRSRESAEALRTMGLTTAMFQRGMIAPSSAINRELLMAPKPAKGGRGRDDWDYERDTARLEYWCVAEPAAVVPICIELLESEPIETLGQLAKGIGIALSVGVPELPPLDVDAITRVLCRRRRVEGRHQDRSLTSACWSFAADLGGAAPHVIPDDYAELSEFALAELGRMRGLFQGDDAAGRFAQERAFLSAAIVFALETQPNESVWGVLRRLFLAMRALPVQSIPNDLWAGPEWSSEQMNEPWWWVPDRITWVFVRYLKRELALDPELKNLRAELARFCLGRIKSKTNTKDQSEESPRKLIEPDPHWRKGYILAARELHAALGPDAHRVLVWSKNKDPEPQVRAAADLAVDVVRREQALPDNKSPRRALMAAFWWLRQAHVLSLGGTVDEVAARETFQKEVRRLARH